MRCPSIDVTYIDDAVDYDLIAKVNDLWPHPAKEEEDDLSEALRSDLRVAIKEVLAHHGVRIVEP